MAYTTIYTNDEFDSLVPKPPSAQLSRTSTVSIANTTSTYVSFSTINWNYGMTYDANGIVVPKAGLYRLDGQFPWAFHTSGTRYMSLIVWRGGVENNRAITQELYAPGQNFSNSWSGLHYLQANDKVRMMVEHNCGASLAGGWHSNTSIGAKLTVTWIRENAA